ncbi:DHS-like NAD/FAD-binding domain-containing protein, partial [Chaetomidium leptoderma]
MAPNPNYNSIPAFHAKLARSRRILAVCGAGLSASSGLPTFRGAGGLWRNYEAMALATPEAFEKDPGLVWMFYAYRRHMALQAKPNAGHYALAALAKRNPEFLCLSQNVDHLHLRASHPSNQLKLLHGSLFTLKCSSPTCTFTEPENFASPLCPALAAAAVDIN